MISYGYLGTLLIQTLIKEIIEIFLENSKCKDDGNPCNELIRVFAEDVYIGFMTAFCIMVWKGRSVCLSAESRGVVIGGGRVYRYYISSQNQAK